MKSLLALMVAALCLCTACSMFEPDHSAANTALEAARSPTSPGGELVTPEEQQHIDTLRGGVPMAAMLLQSALTGVGAFGATVLYILKTRGSAKNRKGNAPAS